MQDDQQQSPARAVAAPLSKRQTTPVAYAFQYLRSKGLKRQHPKRLKQFFDYLEEKGGMNDNNGVDNDNNHLELQARTFLEKVAEEQEHKNNKYWTEEVIMDFLEFHKNRVENRDIAAGTLGTIYQSVKIFCENHDLTYINWKRISRSLPKARKESDDRCPTLEEIRKAIEFPDRRIKPIVYTMVSSGIRVGAWDYLKWKHVIPQKKRKS